MNQTSSLFYDADSEEGPQIETRKRKKLSRTKNEVKDDDTIPDNSSESGTSSCASRRGVLIPAERRNRYDARSVDSSSELDSDESGMLRYRNDHGDIEAYKRIEKCKETEVTRRHRLDKRRAQRRESFAAQMEEMAANVKHYLASDSSGAGIPKKRRRFSFYYSPSISSSSDSSSTDTDSETSSNSTITMRHVVSGAVVEMVDISAAEKVRTWVRKNELNNQNDYRNDQSAENSDIDESSSRQNQPQQVFDLQ